MTVTRFAPSPTGFLHVGGLRTALYNYLFAKKNNGKFILRIEDTDVKRFVEGAIESLIKTLEWAGLSYNEGPFIQSKRIDIYKKHSLVLLEKDFAYRCFCTKERLEQMREEQKKRKLAPKYDGKCRNFKENEIEDLLKKNTPFVVRQKIPHDREEIVFNDLIRGQVRFLCKNLDDQILIKSDGYPTYHIANVVDDHLMGVTHVIRGEEWLPSTPKHILLYEAFGWNKPEFAHLPLLLNKDRTKLSKRQGHVSVEEYINEDYLAEAVINFVALLGWNPGKTEQEIFSLEELVEKFSLEKIHKAGAIFDLDKLNWMNWQWRRKKYLASLPPDSPANSAVHENFINCRMRKLLEFTDKYLPPEWKTDEGFLLRALLTVEEKILQDPKKIKQCIDFYFKDKIEVPDSLLCNAKMGVTKEIAKKSIEAGLEALKNLDNFSSQEKIKETLLAVIEKSGMQRGQVLWPVRVVLTGEEFSPGIFEVIWTLSKDKTIKYLTEFLRVL